MSEPVIPAKSLVRTTSAPSWADRNLGKHFPRVRLLVAKLCALSGTDAVALAEASVLMTLARPLIRLVPFRTIAAAVSTARKPSGHDAFVIAATVDRVAWAVDRSAKRVPTRALCFERGLAAHVMLRRRGLDSTLVYGVAPGDGAGSVLRAHVWVHVDDVEVAGGGEASAYAPMVSFPPGRTHTTPLRARLLQPIVPEGSK